MRYPIAAAGLLASLSLGHAPVFAEDMNVSVRSGRDVRTCGDLEVTFDGRPAVTAVDQLTAPGAQKLTVHGSRNGGVYVFGGPPGLLDQRVQGGGARVGRRQRELAGPGAGQPERRHAVGSGPRVGWLGRLLHHQRANAGRDRSRRSQRASARRAHHRGDDGAFAERPDQAARRGRPGVARTQNGPIAYEGGSGTIELEAQNGPLAVRLAGSKWADGSLTATAQNGPVRLQAPRGFASGVRVRSSQHSPWKCRGCDDGRRTWDDASRSVEFGSGPVA